MWIIYTICSVFNNMWHEGRQALEIVVKNLYKVKIYKKKEAGHAQV